jgi:hypothetical protein
LSSRRTASSHVPEITLILSSISLQVAARIYRISTNLTTYDNAGCKDN